MVRSPRVCHFCCWCRSGSLTRGLRDQGQERWHVPPRLVCIQPQLHRRLDLHFLRGSRFFRGERVPSFPGENFHSAVLSLLLTTSQIGVLYETDVLIAGVRVAIGYSAALISSVIVGMYSAITKKVRYATFVAFIIFTLFFVCMATATKSSSTQVWGYPIFVGCGIGMALVLLITVSQLSTPPELIATASGLVISVRSLGGTIGIAICKYPLFS